MDTEILRETTVEVSGVGMEDQPLSYAEAVAEDAVEH